SGRARVSISHTTSHGVCTPIAKISFRRRLAGCCVKQVSRIPRGWNDIFGGTARRSRGRRFDTPSSASTVVRVAGFWKRREGGQGVSHDRDPFIWALKRPATEHSTANE